MISKDGRYWTTGITVTWQEHAGSDQGGPFSGWRASLDFLDDGFADDDADAGRISTQGKLETRYAVRDGQSAAGLSAAYEPITSEE